MNYCAPQYCLVNGDPSMGANFGWTRTVLAHSKVTCGFRLEATRLSHESLAETVPYFPRAQRRLSSFFKAFWVLLSYSPLTSPLYTPSRRRVSWIYATVSGSEKVNALIHQEAACFGLFLTCAWRITSLYHETCSFPIL